MGGRQPQEDGDRSVRIYRTLVRWLFPREFRAPYGEAMVDLFGEQLDEVRRAGARQVVLLYLTSGRDLLSAAIRVRFGRDPAPWRTATTKAASFQFGFGLGADLWIVARRVVRRPVHSLVAVGILTAGLAAAIAALTYAASYRQPFPGTRPDGLVRLFQSEPDAPFQDLSFLDYEDLRASSSTFSGIAAVQPFYAASVRHEALAEVALIEAVSGSFFHVAEVQMALGRRLGPDDDEADAAPAAVISHAWWIERYGRDPDVLDRTIFLNNRPFTVVGVAGDRFLGSTAEVRPQVWVPFSPFRDRYVSWARQAGDRDLPLVRVFARLAEGVSEEAARTEVEGLARTLDAAYPGRDHERSFSTTSATWIDPRTRAEEGRVNRILALAAAGFLLLVCANVANLQLSVFVRRRREIAIHAALGASPGRRITQALLESVLLSATGGALALLVAVPLSTRIGSYFARPSVWGSNVSREMAMDVGLVITALCVALATGVLGGLIPSIRAGAGGLAASMRGGRDRRLLPRSRIAPTHASLVSTQVALSMVLLVVAGLVLRTLSAVGRLDPGFDYPSLVASHVSTSSTTISANERGGWFRDLAREIADEPWVESATIAQTAPLTPHPTRRWRVPAHEEPQPGLFAPVEAGFFETMGIELVEGRGFGSMDTLGAPRVAVIDRATAGEFFPDGSALGARLSWSTPGGSEEAFEVVGIAGPIRLQSLTDEPPPAVFVPYRQHPYPTGSALLLETRIDPAEAVPLMERWIREREPHAAIVNVAPYPQVIRGAYYAQRMNAELFSGLALLALILASAGTFSVISLTVNRRMKEMGLRRALGATRWAICQTVVRQILLPVLVGASVGLTISIAAADILGDLVIGIDATDPASLLGGGTVLLFSVLLAAYFPARRAALVDPLVAMDGE